MKTGLPVAHFHTFDTFALYEDADDPIEDEYHLIFAWSGCVYAKKLLRDLFSKSMSTIGQFLSQPHPNRVATSLT